MAVHGASVLPYVVGLEIPYRWMRRACEGGRYAEHAGRARTLLVDGSRGVDDSHMRGRRQLA